MEQDRFAENVRRAAGLHLVSIDALAEHLGMTRPGLMKMLRHSAEGRTMPNSKNAVAIAEAFGVDVRDLMSDPRESLRAVVQAFDEAPIRNKAKVPESDAWAASVVAEVVNLPERGSPQKDG
jgi:transcriptional regulator with XRE-family HTH domain